jgi:hypothetical protein
VLVNCGKVSLLSRRKSPIFENDHEDKNENDFQSSDSRLKAGLRSRGAVRNQRRGEAGSTLVELSVTLFLIMAIGAMTLQTMTSSWLMQKWTVAQSMTDAYAAIETANAQRWVFSEIPTGNPPRWPQFPQFATVPVTIGYTPNGAVNATVYRTCVPSNPSNVNGENQVNLNSTDPNAAPTVLTTYILESYVVYQDGQRTYCKLSKVIRTE